MIYMMQGYFMLGDGLGHVSIHHIYHYESLTI